MKPLLQIRPQQYRSVWISDVHLGYRGCKAEFLLDFLQSIDTEYLFLVGDIIDLWSMRKSLFWPQSHNNVVRTILGKAKQGTKVIYIPGNHDEDLREMHGMIFGNLEIHTEYVHQTTDGRKVLMLHGDQFDAVIKCSRLMNLLGNLGYDLLLYFHRLLDRVRHRLGFSYWSLTSYLKGKVKNAMAHVTSFETAVAQEAAKRGMDVVICGHIHHAEIRQIKGVLYCNDGDWVENCTALVERQNGMIELIHWSDRQRMVKNDTPLRTEAIDKVA